MSVTQHPTAIISPKARLGQNIEIGPYSVIGDNVQLGDNIKIHSHVVIDGHTRIGAGCEVFPFAAIGLAPQHTRYEGEASELIIGENNLMREYVTMHPGTKVGDMKTVIGDNNLFYVGAHIAHDCVVGNHVILANHVGVGGHVTIGDYAYLGAIRPSTNLCVLASTPLSAAEQRLPQMLSPMVLLPGQEGHCTG